MKLFKLNVNVLGLLLLALCVAACRGSKTAASNYQTIYDTTKAHYGQKILKGIITHEVLKNDTAMPWYSRNYTYAPAANTGLVKIFNENKNKFTLMVFMGTWCEDSQNLIPAFYKFIHSTALPAKSLAVYGVDRKKQTLNNINQTHKITNVPTFIVLSNGKEVGRVVEYGKYNDVPKELAEIITKNIQ